MNDRELMQQALEALENIPEDVEGYLPAALTDVVIALRERLAQPEQEPVAIVTSETGNPDITMSWWHEPALPVGTPLYTTPPQRKPLTDEELYKVFPAIATYTEANKTLYRSIARSIEAAHGIKE